MYSQVTIEDHTTWQVMQSPQNSPRKIQSENFVRQFWVWALTGSPKPWPNPSYFSVFPGSSRSFWSSTIVQCECTCPLFWFWLEALRGTAGDFFSDGNNQHKIPGSARDFGFSQPTSHYWGLCKQNSRKLALRMVQVLNLDMRYRYKYAHRQ